MNQLTHRENEVLELVILGLSNDEIAGRLAISRRTVETHLRTVFQKTGVTRRTQLLALSGPGNGTVQATPPGAVELAGGPGARHRAPPAKPAENSGLLRRVQLYADAMRRLTDRQFPLFEERVEITVLIGDQDGQDSVIERRWTTPKPYLAYRIAAPIVARTDGQPCDPDQLALACDVYGHDIRADVSAVHDEDGTPLVMVLFQPGLQARTEWTLRYQSPRLWAPLRAGGEDTLTYATATFDKRHRPTIDELTLTVVFPVGWEDQRVSERAGLGTSRVDRLATGQTQVTWHNRGPVAAAYDWVLTGRHG